MALLETLEIHVFDFHDGCGSAKAILVSGRRETVNEAPTFHLKAQLKDSPTPSRGARPTASSPDKFDKYQRKREIRDKPTCVIWLMPWATTTRSASRVHSMENGSSGRMGFASEEEKWECLSIKKSICWRSTGMAASSQTSTFHDLITASAYIDSHPRHACMLSIRIMRPLPCPDLLYFSCLQGVAATRRHRTHNRPSACRVLHGPGHPCRRQQRVECVGHEGIDQMASLREQK